MTDGYIYTDVDLLVAKKNWQSRNKKEHIFDGWPLNI